MPWHPTQGNQTPYCPWGDSTTFGQVNDANLILNPTISGWGWKFFLEWTIPNSDLQQHSWRDARHRDSQRCSACPLFPGLLPSSPCTQSQLLCVKKTNGDRETVWWPLQSLLLVGLFETDIEESWQTQSVNECGEHTLKHHNGLEIRGSVSSYQLH